MRSSRSSARATPAELISRSLHQPRRHAHPGERVAAEAPVLARLAARLQHAFVRPRSRSAARSCGRPGRARPPSAHFLFDDAAAQRAGDRSTHERSSLQMRPRIEARECPRQVLVRGPAGIAVGLRLHDLEHRVQVARVLARQSATLQAELPARLRAGRDRQLRPCRPGSARRRSRRAPPPRARAAGRRRHRAPSTRKRGCGLSSISRYRSPALAPPLAGAPWPARRRCWPGRMPRGMWTSRVRSCIVIRPSAPSTGARSEIVALGAAVGVLEVDQDLGMVVLAVDVGAARARRRRRAPRRPNSDSKKSLASNRRRRRRTSQRCRTGRAALAAANSKPASQFGGGWKLLAGLSTGCPSGRRRRASPGPSAPRWPR